jgi:hypothetical protein
MLRTTTVGAAVGLLVACALPVAEKTACRSSDDCVEDRFCDDGRCRDGACEALCTAVCDGADECSDAPSDCEARCVAGDDANPQLLPTLGAAQCRRLWDEVQADDGCDRSTCTLLCGELCRIARDCELVVDAAACVEGCVARNENCQPPTPTNCISVPADVLCYEDVDACPQ